VLFAALGTLLLIFPLVQGREYGWPAWAFVMLGAARAGVRGVRLYEVRRERRGADPLVTPSLFRKRAFTGGWSPGWCSSPR
jgi:hypothetical protein